MSGRETILHLASGVGAASVVREAMTRLGRAEDVGSSDDWLSEGALAGIDEAGGPERRVAWFRKLQPDPAQEVPSCDDTAMIERARAAEHVVIWHGAHPAERLFMLRACWHLRASRGDVLEVAMPRTKGTPGGQLVAVHGPNAAMSQWDHRQRITNLSERAALWERLRDEPGEWVRQLENDTITSHPVTSHDAAILEKCAHGFTRSLLVVAQILAESSAGLNLIVWRCRELTRAGRIEVRGSLNRIDLAEEIAARADG